MCGVKRLRLGRPGELKGFPRRANWHSHCFQGTCRYLISKTQTGFQLAFGAYYVAYILTRNVFYSEDLKAKNHDRKKDFCRISL